MKVVIAAGGTGGHLYPGIAVAEELKKRDIETLFLVSDRGIERDVLRPLGYELVEQHVSGFKGVSFFNKIKALAKLAGAITNTEKHLTRNDKVLLLGGFVSAPVAVAAILKGVDVYIHEQNSIMGFANKFLSSVAKKVLLSYPNTKGAPARAVLVGNPVRASLMNGAVKENDGKNILVLGGSGGSRIVNKTFADVADRLLGAGYKIRHQTGKKLFDETVEAYKNADVDITRLEVLPYIDDMAQAYEWADVVVGRSGSGVVFEVSYARRPALYIPFAQATDNHQYYNARWAEEHKYATILQERDVNPNSLFDRLIGVFRDIKDYKLALEGTRSMNSVTDILANMEIE
ncbi:undecaprenyldiphospho-muramoylpentapeptide beta-N-acetylglucosaminyltransferase [Deferribacterales bacterium RsTz2092]|nr:UDP-N-acetylglucosamine--N-acetylmuramyl-(pentapeptide) pyrophosphoryl-undecaprenol N-acetylglucosamine transferase [Deferribacterales bacterium]